MSRLAPFPEGRYFQPSSLKEPLKREVLNHKRAPQSPPDLRRYPGSQGNRTFEAAFDLTAGLLISWEQIKGVQPR